MLQAAAHRTATPVAIDSELGRHIRARLTATRRSAGRELPYTFEWFVIALRGVLTLTRAPQLSPP